MPSESAWTIQRLLQWTTDFLRARGSASPRLDAEVLLAHARDCQRIELYTAYDELATEELRSRFRDLVRQRSEGKPVAYLVGHREFYSLPFSVTPDVLIPRPETEHLVVEVLELAKNMLAPTAIADVGTGSGIIAVCCAKYLPDARVWATDISTGALAVAAQNVSRHELQDRVTLLEGDLLTPIPADVTFDIIASNPPYVSRREYESLPVDVREYEPATALVAGPTGAEIIARLVPQAADRLRPNGWFVCELSPMICDHILALLEQEPRLHNVAVIPDLAGHRRVIRAQRVGEP